MERERSKARQPVSPEHRGAGRNRARPQRDARTTLRKRRGRSASLSARCATLTRPRPRPPAGGVIPSPHEQSRPQAHERGGIPRLGRGPGQWPLRTDRRAADRDGAAPSMSRRRLSAGNALAAAIERAGVRGNAYGKALQLRSTDRRATYPTRWSIAESRWRATIIVPNPVIVVEVLSPFTREFTPPSSSPDIFASHRSHTTSVIREELTFMLPLILAAGSLRAERGRIRA